MKIDVKEIKHGTSEYEQEIALREKILRKPLGLSFSKEELAREIKDIHLGAYRGEHLLGCLVLTVINEFKIKMRQVAVDESQQGLGIGQLLVQTSEARAQILGFSEIELNARATAVPFYLHLGYEAFGEPFIEVTVPHQKMKKQLK